jgi:hypothetical protein
MPTPESEAFLAKKPKVPPTFDGVDYDDTKRLKQAQDAIIREQWVQVMMGRLVREELSKCYYREGVNHLEKCGRLRGWFIPGRGGGPSSYGIGNIGCSRTSTKVGSCGQGADATTERYLDLLKNAKVKGYLFEQQNYYSKEGQQQ